MRASALVIACLIAAASAQQWGGAITYFGSSCSDDKMITTYNAAKISAQGCIVKGAFGNEKALKVNCADLTNLNPATFQQCNDDCTGCVAPPAFPPFSVPPSPCTTSGSCTTCVLPGLTQSSTARCFPSSAAGGWGMRTFQIRTYPDATCTGGMVAVSGYNADAATCIVGSPSSWAAYGANGTFASGKFDCPASSTANGKLSLYTSADCTGTAVDVTIDAAFSACKATGTTGVRFACGVGAGSAVTVSFVVMAFAAIFAFLF